MQNFLYLTEGNVTFLQMLAALKRAGCDVWRLSAKQRHFTAGVESDHVRQ